MANLLERVAVPGALEVLLADREGLQRWARRALGWPGDKDAWARIGAVLGSRDQRYPRASAAWAHRARPGRPRAEARRQRGPVCLVLPRLAGLEEKCIGKFMSGLPSTPASSECESLSCLREIDPARRMQECWLLDEDSMSVLGGFRRNFASARTRNRWLRKSQVLLATQLAVSRSSSRAHLPAGRMVGFGVASPRGVRELHEYLAKPALRAEPEGLTTRANCTAQHGLAREFLSHVEAHDPCLSDELVAFHAAFPDAPPPMWTSLNYQVR